MRVGYIMFDISLSVNYSDLKPRVSELTSFIAEELDVNISQSYDATTHFESTVKDVLNLYTAITGKVLDLNVDLSAASAAEE